MTTKSKLIKVLGLAATVIGVAANACNRLGQRTENG